MSLWKRRKGKKQKSGVTECGLNSHGLREGVCITQDADGVREITYKNGIANGYFKIEFTGGGWMEGTYTDGVVHGWTEHYDGDRVLVNSQRFSRGIVVS